MSEILQKIEIRKVVLNQYRSMLYDMVVYTSDRDYAYEHDQSERIESEKEIYDSEFIDSVNYRLVTTKKLNSVEIINIAKRLKQFFDDRNAAIDRINEKANEMEEIVKTSLEAIFETEVEIKG